jgi:Ca2+-binding RTX toxin-like protein
MTTLTLSSKLNETDLSGLLSPSQIKSQVSSIFSDLQGEIFFNEEPTNNVLKNPTFSGSAGDYQTSGSVKYKTDNYGEIMSVSSNFNGATILTDSGKITITGTLTSNVAATGDFALSQNITGISFVGEDGSKWSVSGGYTLKHSYTTKSDKEINTYSENYTSLSSTDSNKNTITFTGKINGSQDVDGNFMSTGAITDIALNMGSTKLSATGLALTFDDLENFQMGSVADLLPIFLSGNDVITIPKDFGDSVFGYGGNDSIIGSADDDAIIGGAGNDTLNGGAGNDTFTFMMGGESVDGGYGNDSMPANVSYSDVIDGGAGDDIVNLFDYSATERRGIYSVSGTPKNIIIRDLVTNSVTEIKNVETFSFSDGELTAEELLVSPTATTLTGSDLLSNIGIVGAGENGYWDGTVGDYVYFDPSLTEIIANYASEDWAAASSGSDNYDPDLASLQTIKLKSTEKSSLTFTQQQDGKVKASSYDFVSSDKKVTLQSVYSNTDSDTNENSTHQITYTNTGEAGASDDIKATQSETSTETKSLKNGLWTANETRKYALNYAGGGYKIDIATTQTEKSSYSDYDFANSNPDIRSISSYHEINTISKYSFSNAETGFNLTLAGTSTQDSSYSDVDYSRSEKVSLSKVTLTSSDFKLTATKVSYDATYDEEMMQDYSGITNIIYSPMVSVEAIVMTYVVPNVMNGDNTITITNKEGAVIDAGSGKDVVVGNIGDDKITGGAGSDKLTGGKGADTFSFSNADFFTENASGDLVFNKSADTITDFKLVEGDSLDFSDLGDLYFYKTVNDAKLEDARLFYVIGSGKIYFNTDMTGEKYTATPIITLTGNPKATVDAGWDYPM